MTLLRLYLISLLFAFCPAGQAQERIVSLAPHITELLFAVGAGSEIVGVDAHSDYPAQAEQIPHVGDALKLNFEAILTLNPTLVVAWESGNGAENIARLRQLGLNVQSHEPQTLSDVAVALEQMGALSGHPEQGQQAAREFRQKLQTLTRLYANNPSHRVYYQLWNDPQMTLNGKHLVSDVLAQCGAHNIFADAIPLVPRLSIESVVVENPDVIVGAAEPEERPSWVSQWQRWPSVKAVKNGAIVWVDGDLLHRHGPRILQGMEQLCQQLAGAAHSG